MPGDDGATGRGVSEARALLEACCIHCTDAPGHQCERTPSPRFAEVDEPGRLDPSGPLSESVQSRLESITGRRITSGNRVRVLVDGVQAYGAMLELVETARRQVLFENFIFRSDAVGLAFARELRSRSEQGIDVRVLHDPFGWLGSLRAPIGFRFHGSPARVRVYNPPRPTPAFFRWGRDHRKLVVQDGFRAVVGGLCLSDAWLGNCVRNCAWRDSALLVEGPASAEMAVEFRTTWARGTSFTPWRRGPERSDEPRQPKYGSRGLVPVRVVVDDRALRRVEHLLLQVIAAARRDILITNPYFVPPESLRAALIAAASRGVDVQILIPGSNDHPIVGLTAAHLVGSLLRAGARVWAWTGPMVHAKTVAVDRCWSFIGSSNLDFLSLRRNAELNVEVHGSALAEQLVALFDADRARSTPLTVARWRGRPRWRRIVGPILGLARAWQ